MEADAAKDAAKLQAAYGQKAIDEQRRQFDLTRADFEPWMRTGKLANERLQYLMGLGGKQTAPMSKAEYQALLESRGNRYDNPTMIAALDKSYDLYVKNFKPVKTEGTDFGSLLKDFTLDDFKADPGYQFRLGEGTRAIENSAAARGMQLSGATLKGLSRFGQDFASNEFSKAYDRDMLNKTRKFNFLTGQSGAGQQTATNLGSMGGAVAGNIADTYLQAGNARAAGQVGAANAWTNAIRDTTGYYQLRNMLKPATSNCADSKLTRRERRGNNALGASNQADPRGR